MKARYSLQGHCWTITLNAKDRGHNFHIPDHWRIAAIQHHIHELMEWLDAS